MEAAGIHHFELILLFLLILVAGLATLARRFEVPYPIVLVIGGLFVSLIPHLPQISLNPHIVFLVFLPPLLYVASTHASWRDFRLNMINILLLAMGLVGITVLGVSLGVGWLLPGFDYRLGAVLGAVVATTDPIAAGAIAKRLGLPQRISDILEGESLVNDATGLLALQFTVALVATGERPTIGFALLKISWLILGGVAVGLIAGVILYKLFLKITDSAIEITLGLIAPYIAYLAAEGVHSSGVLAVVVCGLYLGRKNSEVLSMQARLENSAVWNTLEFILNGIVFILIGLQLPFILREIRNESLSTLLWVGALFPAFLIVLRLVWVFLGAWISHFLRTKFGGQPEPKPEIRQVFLVGWTGMRGVLALAAALSLPTAMGDGSPFPQRSVIIFLTFCVIFVTLILQGLTLPWVIRKLGLDSGEGQNREESEARRLILSAALEYLQKLQWSAKSEHQEIYTDFARHYQQRLALIDAGGYGVDQTEREVSTARYQRNLSRELRVIERNTALNLRNENKINDQVLRKLERELDLIDSR